MNCKELVSAVAANNPEVSAAKIKSIVDSVFEELEEGLALGRGLIVRDMLTISVVERKGHTGRNPRTGEPIEIPARRKLKIKAGKRLGERLNKS
jgi:integration host factor subunit beta